jgi:hypothetical protein
VIMFPLVALAIALAVAIDGDTAIIDGEIIRIANIDAPELHEARCDAERRLAFVVRARLASCSPRLCAAWLMLTPATIGQSAVAFRGGANTCSGQADSLIEAASQRTRRSDLYSYIGY